MGGLKGRQTFVQGAFILVLANIVVKIIGALYKLPLTRMIGEQAMGYFNSAYSIFTTFFIIATAGLPVAMSRMVAAAEARGNQREVRLIFKVSMTLFFIIGLAGTGIMAAISGAVEGWTSQFGLQFSLLALSPTLFFIGVISAFRGYFQGLHNMVPTAVSQTIEALGKLAFGLLLSYLSMQAFPGQPWIHAAFAILGVTIGILFSSAYLTFSKTVLHRAKEADSPEAARLPLRSGKNVLKELTIIAIPITIAAVMINLTSNIDVFTIVRILTNNGMDKDIANTLYGAYTSIAVTLFNLVPALTQGFSISIIPSVSAALAKKDSAAAKKTMDSSLKIVSSIVLPATFGMIALAAPIIDFLFGTRNLTYAVSDAKTGGAELKTLTDSAGLAVTNVDVAMPLLVLLSLSIFFTGIYSVTGAILQASGLERKSIISSGAGILTKLVFACLLISIPAIGIYGAPISTTLCYLLMFILNFAFLLKYAKYRPRIREFFLRPFFASLVCGASAFGLYRGLHLFGMGRLALFISIFGAILIYLVLLLLIKGVVREDILMLPKGEKIARFLAKLKLLRD